MFGSEVQGGYQYAGLAYVPRNTFPSHGPELSSCVGCHMGGDAPHSHTFEPDITRCQACHSGSTFETLSGSPGQNHDQIQFLLADLLQAIQDYASTTLDAPVIYDGEAYPYFFHDNGQGANFPNRYREFDEALLRAAYNYQFGIKEPAGFVHNGTYLRQVLYDSILALGGTVSTGVNVPPDRAGYEPNSNMYAQRTEQYHVSGHGAAGDAPFRHWDEDDPPEVASSCAKCHSTPGFMEFAMDDPVSATSPRTLVECTACHKQQNLYADDETRYDDLTTNPALDPVVFPSGDTVTLSDASNVCMACHQGRASQQTVDDATAVAGPYSFINIHYFAAAATFFGKDVNAGYQYRADTAYRGQKPFASHPDSLNTCIGCHLRGDKKEHVFMPEVADCAPCHGTPPTSFHTLGGTPGANYTAIWGTGGLLEDLLAAIEDYATNTIGKPIIYDPAAYPYFFYDNGTGPIYPNRYVDFDATLLEAAYNYQVGRKDPGDYIHNGTYTRQILYDSLDDLDNGAQDNSVTGQTRLP